MGRSSTSAVTIPSFSVGRLAMVVLLSFGLEGDGQCRLLGAGEVGVADPDQGEVDGQGEQGDSGGDQEAAGEAGGNCMAVDRRGERVARVRRVSGLRGGGGGVDGL